jgi:hypothetical protein
MFTLFKTFSSGGRESIATCSVNNFKGKGKYNGCNELFGGTSASSPLAAGLKIKKIKKIKN